MAQLLNHLKGCRHTNSIKVTEHDILLEMNEDNEIGYTHLPLSHIKSQMPIDRAAN